MATELSWFDDDGVTPVSLLDLGSVPPGQDYITRNGGAKEVILKNTGDDDLSTVAVEIQQVSSSDLHEMVRIAPDSSGSPGVFVDKDTDPLTLGALAADAEASVYIDIVMALDTSVEAGKLANLFASGAV